MYDVAARLAELEAATGAAPSLGVRGIVEAAAEAHTVLASAESDATDSTLEPADRMRARAQVLAALAAIRQAETSAYALALREAEHARQARTHHDPLRKFR